MKFHDLTRALLEKVDSCPNCQGKLAQVSTFRIECEQCGFRFYTTSRYREDMTYTSIGAGMLVGLAIVITAIVSSWWFRTFPFKG